MSLSSSLSRALKAHHTLRYNAALPISIEVLEEVGRGRYKLKVGHKEMTTRSQKVLHVKERYWGNFSESQEGILTISHLRKKPALLQHDAGLLPMDSFGLLDLLLHAKTPSLVFKQWLLEQLCLAEEKRHFQTLSSMLLALHEGIVHLPLRIEGRSFLIQWKENKSLNEPLVHFYLAYENLGALQGTLYPMRKTIHLETLFERTATFLARHTANSPLSLTLEASENVVPLWEGNHALLDLRG